MKKIFTAAFIIATIAMGAQTKMKKACIKVESEENGKVTKIDTCFTAATDEELQAKIDALGIGGITMPPTPPTPPSPLNGSTPPTPPDMPDMPEIVIEMDSAAGGKTITCTKVIVIDDGEDGKGSKKSGKKKKMKVSSSTGKDGETEVIVMDGEGNTLTHDKTGNGRSYAYTMDSVGNMVTTNSKDRTKVEVRHLKPGEKMDTEIERIMKENGFSYEYNTENGNTSAKKIVIRNSDNKNGREKNEVKVFVFSKMEVKTLSEADKKQLPANASKAISNGKTFENLNVAPNPTEDACTVSYKSVSKEPLQIKVYDTEGKTVLTETDNNVNDQVNKTLSLKGLGQGVYFVHLTQGKQSEVRKVIVK